VKASLVKLMSVIEMGPDPTQAYFWPAVNKRLTQLRPGYFLTRPEAIFLTRREKKMKNLTFLGVIFQIQTQTINGLYPTRPKPQKIDLTQPGSLVSYNKEKRLFLVPLCKHLSWGWHHINRNLHMKIKKKSTYRNSPCYGSWFMMKIDNLAINVSINPN